MAFAMGLALGTVLAATIFDIVERKGLWTLWTVGCLALVCLSAGWTWGRQLLWDSLTKPQTVSFVGGPLDGIVNPLPPFVGEGSMVTVDDHPEGRYALDGDRLLWQELE
jgi:hypothetical protein